MDRYLGLGAVVGAVIYLAAASRLPTAVLGDPLGPAVFPYFIGGLMLLTGAVLVVRPGSGGPAPDQGAVHHVADAQPLWTVLGIVAILVWSGVYFLALRPVGYPVATVLYLLGLLTFMHPRHHVANVATALGSTAASSLLFSALGVPLPTSF